jgi:uncharacterized protein YqjF (DUF2071 family)
MKGTEYRVETAEILHTVQHRPYPLPSGPWIIHQTWHEVLFSHWPISTEVLRPLVPASLQLDTFAGEAWVGIVPFRMSDVRPRAIPPLPVLSAFPELNVRTYVICNGIPGVYFFSLDAGNSLAVAGARALFHLPYFHARMESKALDKIIHYTSHRVHRGARSADYRARYRPVTPVIEAPPGSLEAWFTERYCLYTTAGSCVYRGDIQHIRWPLQVAELETETNTMAHAHNIHLPDTAPLLHYAQHQDVLIWPLRRVSTDK